MRTASWVIRERASGRVILETFDPVIVERLNAGRYEAVPILAYLQELNRTIRKETT